MAITNKHFGKFSWDIVVVGLWNQYLLMPAGIHRYVTTDPNKAAADVSSETPLNVEFFLDAFTPPAVSLQGVVVTPNNENVIFRPVTLGDFDAFPKGIEFACNLLENLSKTPYKAAGLNFRSEIETEELDFETTLSIDKIFSNDVFDDMENTPIIRKHIVKTFQWNDGVLNFQITKDGQKLRTMFNFHRTNESYAQLIDWIRQDNEKMFQFVDKLLGAF